MRMITPWPVHCGECARIPRTRKTTGLLQNRLIISRHIVDWMHAHTVQCSIRTMKVITAVCTRDVVRLERSCVNGCCRRLKSRVKSGERQRRQIAATAMGDSVLRSLFERSSGGQKSANLIKLVCVFCGFQGVSDGHILILRGASARVSGFSCSAAQLHLSPLCRLVIIHVKRSPKKIQNVTAFIHTRSHAIISRHHPSPPLPSTQTTASQHQQPASLSAESAECRLTGARKVLCSCAGDNTRGKPHNVLAN